MNSPDHIGFGQVPRCICPNFKYDGVHLEGCPHSMNSSNKGCHSAPPTDYDPGDEKRFPMKKDATPTTDMHEGETKNIDNSANVPLSAPFAVRITTKTTDWRETFDKEFPRFTNRAFTDDTADIIKAFIADLLNSAADEIEAKEFMGINNVGEWEAGLNNGLRAAQSLLRAMAKDTV